MRLLSYNLENLFLYSGPNSQAHPLEKSHSKCMALAQIMSEIDPDIMMLSEVGGFESLNRFNQTYLNARYSIHLIQGNSDRGIECAYLTKKQLAWRFHHLGHRDFELDLKLANDLPGQVHRFSRDISELEVYTQDSNLPTFCLFLIHLKSRRNDRIDDPHGHKRRQAEVKKLIHYYLQRQKEWKYKVPILVAGDFNGMAQKNAYEAEFAPLYNQTDLQDVLEIANRPMHERTTLYYFEAAGKSPKELQLDYIFIPNAWKDRLIAEETFVYRYKELSGKPIQDPISQQEIYHYPSDHFPLVASFKLD